MCECVCICECVHVCGVCVHMCLGAAWMKEGPMMRGKVGACHPEPIPRPAALSPRPAPAAPGTLRPGEVTELQQFPKARTQRNILELCIILFKYLKNHVPASG